jgi:hypothetical protein
MYVPPHSLILALDQVVAHLSILANKALCEWNALVIKSEIEELDFYKEHLAMLDLRRNRR